jgi:hypothetical protein
VGGRSAAVAGRGETTSPTDRQRDEVTGRRLHASRVERTWQPVDSAGARWQQWPRSYRVRTTPVSGRRLSGA